MIFPRTVPSRTKYCEIKKLKVNRAVYNNITFTGQCEILGIFNRIGPYSGVVLLTADNKTEQVNFWDQWCYYERGAFHVNVTINKFLKLEITDKKFDRSSSKKQLDWDSQKMKLVLHDVYYTSGYLEFKDH